MSRRFSALPQSYIFDNDYLMGSGAKGRLRLSGDSAKRHSSCVWTMPGCSLTLEGSAPDVLSNRVAAAITSPNMSIHIEDDLGVWTPAVPSDGTGLDQGTPLASEPGHGLFVIQDDEMDCGLSASEVPAGQSGDLKVYKAHVKPKTGCSRPSGGQRVSVVKHASRPLRSVDDVDKQFRDLLNGQGKVRRK